MWKLGLWPRIFFSGNICFKFSVSCLCTVYSSSPSHHGIFWVLVTCHLSTHNQHYIASACLPNHMMGEVSWDPKRRRVWASKYSILSGSGHLGATMRNWQTYKLQDFQTYFPCWMCRQMKKRVKCKKIHVYGYKEQSNAAGDMRCLGCSFEVKRILHWYGDVRVLLFSKHKYNVLSGIMIICSINTVLDAAI